MSATTPAQIMEKLAAEQKNIRAEIDVIKSQIAKVKGIQGLPSTVDNLQRTLGILEALKRVEWDFRDEAERDIDDQAIFVNFLHELVSYQGQIATNGARETRHFVEGQTSAIREVSSWVRYASIDARRDQERVGA
jgi:hypothetical protein